MRIIMFVIAVLSVIGLFLFGPIITDFIEEKILNTREPFDQYYVALVSCILMISIALYAYTFLSRIHIRTRIKCIEKERYNLLIYANNYTNADIVVDIVQIRGFYEESPPDDNEKEVIGKKSSLEISRYFRGEGKKLYKITFTYHKKGYPEILKCNDLCYIRRNHS